MKNDLTNKKFGKLTVIKFLRYDNKKESNFWLCTCECGNQVERSTKSLKESKNPSCGCYKVERCLSGLNKKHNISKTQIYKLWKDMKKRVKTRKSYIKLNIKVCDEWLNNPELFYQWAISNGYKKGLQLDRINTYDNYSPDNCRFVTCKENQNNRTNTIYVHYNNELIPLSKASELSGIPYKTLQQRYYRNGENFLFLSSKEYRNRGK